MRQKGKLSYPCLYPIILVMTLVDLPKILEKLQRILLLLVMN